MGTQNGLSGLTRYVVRTGVRSATSYPVPALILDGYVHYLIEFNSNDVLFCNRGQGMSFLLLPSAR